MHSELHIFVIWSNGLYLKEPIIDDIKKHFHIKQIFNCRWDKMSFALKLSQFYGKKLFQGFKKEIECGNDEFLAVIVSDDNPLYVNGININVAQLKYKYRKWCKGGFLIHASDNAEEAALNLKFLTGMSVDEFFARYPTDWDEENFVSIENAPVTLHKKESFCLKLLRGFKFLF